MNIKKIIFIIFLFLIINNVSAQELDKIKIDSFKTNIAVSEEGKYYISEEYDYSIKFGEEPSERYFYKLLKNNYDYSYGNKMYKHLPDYDITDIQTELGSGMNQTENGLLLYFGKSEKLLNEKGNIQLDYVATFDEKEKDVYSYVISDNQYETDKIYFLIMFPFELNNKVIEFSLNNKDFTSKIYQLEYNIKDLIFIEGTYVHKLKENETLSFRVASQNSRESIEKSINWVLIIIIFIVIFPIFILITKRKLTKRNI